MKKVMIALLLSASVGSLVAMLPKRQDSGKESSKYRDVLQKELAQQKEALKNFTSAMRTIRMTMDNTTQKAQNRITQLKAEIANLR